MNIVKSQRGHLHIGISALQVSLNAVTIKAVDAHTAAGGKPADLFASHLATGYRTVHNTIKQNSLQAMARIKALR